MTTGVGDPDSRKQQEKKPGEKEAAGRDLFSSCAAAEATAAVGDVPPGLVNCRLVQKSPGRGREVTEAVRPIGESKRSAPEATRTPRNNLWH